jgi:hypothetical protein
VLSLLLNHEHSGHRRMHRNTASDHSSVHVHPEHAEVIAVAAGGTPIEYVAPEPVANKNSDRPRNKPRTNRSQSGRRDYRSQGGRRSQRSAR